LWNELGLVGGGRRKEKKEILWAGRMTRAWGGVGLATIGKKINRLGTVGYWVIKETGN